MIIKKEPINKVIQIAKGITSDQYPLLKHILVKRQEDKLIITATDLTLWLVAFVGNCENDIEILPPAHEFAEIIAHYDDNADIEITPKDNHWIHIQSNNCEYNLAGLPLEDYPQLPINILENDNVELNSAEFKSAINKVIIASEKKSYFLQDAVLIEIKDNLMALVATDGHRLAYHSLETEAPEFNIVVSKKCLEMLMKIMEDEIIKIGNAKDYIYFRNSQYILIAKALNYSFPKYNDIITEEYPNKVIIPRDVMIRALQRVAIIAEDTYNAIQIAINHNNMLIKSKSMYGDAEERLSCESDVEVKISFNANYILQFLKVVDDDIVEMNINIENKGKALFSAINNDKYKYVLMPLDYEIDDKIYF